MGILRGTDERGDGSGRRRSRRTKVGVVVAIDNIIVGNGHGHSGINAYGHLDGFLLQGININKNVPLGRDSLGYGIGIRQCDPARIRIHCGEQPRCRRRDVLRVIAKGCALVKASVGTTAISIRFCGPVAQSGCVKMLLGRIACRKGQNGLNSGNGRYNDIKHYRGNCCW